MKMEAKPVDPN